MSKKLKAQISPREFVTFEPLKMNPPSSPTLHIPHWVDIGEGPSCSFQPVYRREIMRYCCSKYKHIAEVKRFGKEEHTRHNGPPTCANEI
jgi:hypothetical protein